MQVLGKSIIVIGILLVAVGIFMIFSPRVPWLGKLPGDIIIKRGENVFYFPIATCVLISVILSVISYFISRK